MNRTNENANFVFPLIDNFIRFYHQVLGNFKKKANKTISILLTHKPPKDRRLFLVEIINSIIICN
jgi:hypothetical protein